MKNSIKIQIVKHLPITLGSKISIDDHSVLIDEAVMCGGVTTIRGFIKKDSQMNIDKVETQSEEEKEALDSIVSKITQDNSLVGGLASAMSNVRNAIKGNQGAVATEHQEAMSAFSGEVEWNGEDLPPVGVECNFTPHNTRWGFNYIENFTGTVLHYEGEQFVFMLNHTKYKLDAGMVIVSRTDKGDFAKPETPQQHEDRERLEAAYDLFCVYNESDGATPCSFDVFTAGTVGNARKRFLAIVDKTNYRKVVK